jgi:hypothetical protein
VRDGARKENGGGKVGRSRRRHWHQFAASVALRSRLLRQRRVVVDAYAAGQVVTVWAEGDYAAAAGEGIRKPWAIAPAHVVIHWARHKVPLFSSSRFKVATRSRRSGQGFRAERLPEWDQGGFL